MSEISAMKLGLRILNISTGVIFIALALVVLIDDNLATRIALTILGASLFLLGGTRIVVGIYLKEEEKLVRIIKIVFGSILIPISLVIMIYQQIATELLVILFASALVGNGILRIIVVLIEKPLPEWYKILSSIVGLLTIIIGIIAAIFTQYGVYTLVFLLSIILILNGIVRIMYAYVKR